MSPTLIRQYHMNHFSLPVWSIASHSNSEKPGSHHLLDQFFNMCKYITLLSFWTFQVNILDKNPFKMLIMLFQTLLDSSLFRYPTRGQTPRTTFKTIGTLLPLSTNRLGLWAKRVHVGSLQGSLLVCLPLTPDRFKWLSYMYIYIPFLGSTPFIIETNSSLELL